MQTENDFNYNLDIPQKEGAPGYVGMFFTLWLKVASTISHPDFTKSSPMSVYYLINWTISAIPEEAEIIKIREKIRARRIEMQQEYKNEGRTLDEKVQDHILLMATIEGASLIAQYIDKHIGISSENKIGWGVDKNKDIIIKNSLTDLKIRALESQIIQKDLEILHLKEGKNVK